MFNNNNKNNNINKTKAKRNNKASKDSPQKCNFPVHPNHAN